MQQGLYYSKKPIKYSQHFKDFLFDFSLKSLLFDERNKIHVLKTFRLYMSTFDRNRTGKIPKDFQMNEEKYTNICLHLFSQKIPSSIPRQLSSIDK